MNSDKNVRAMHPVSAGQVPRPPRKCDGQFYTIRASVIGNNRDFIYSLPTKLMLAGFFYGFWLVFPLHGNGFQMLLPESHFCPQSETLAILPVF